MMSQEVIDMNTFREWIRKNLKRISAVTFILIAVFCFVNRRFFSAEFLTAHMPEQPFAAVCFILLMYLLKTLAVSFPIRVIELAAGAVFPAAWAYLLNLTGNMLGFAVAYGMGRLLGADFVSQLTDRYPKFKTMVRCQHSSTVFFCIIVRSITFIPSDIISMYLGASKSDFGKYMLGSTVGVLPSVAIATYLGHYLLEPRSLQFLVSIGLLAFLSVVSLIVYLLYIRKYAAEKKDS